MLEAEKRVYLVYGLLSAGAIVFTAYLAWSYAHISVVMSMVIGVNAAALLCMGLDKFLARSHSMRIPEIIFYLIAFLGGGVGILSGIHIFRHKTRKAAFQLVLLIVFAVQLALIRIVGGELR